MALQHQCSLERILSVQQLDVLKETLEAALEESKEVLKRHELDVPPGADETSTSEGADAYLQVIGTHRDRMRILRQLHSLADASSIRASVDKVKVVFNGRP